VLDETLRLYPPVPLLVRQASRDYAVRDRTVPAGSLVMVVPWLLHRHQKIWHLPDAFLPERFLPENAAQRRRFAYVPFSLGPRTCAGMAFAIAEAVLALATLAGRFRLRLRPGSFVEPVCRLTLRPSPGLPMLIEERRAFAAASAASAA
jgi:cytochrome P450